MYRPASFGVVRMAALPLRHPAVAVTARPDGAAADQRGSARLLLDLVADPVVREAIQTSSASLAATIARIESGRPVDQARVDRAVLSVTRYLLRMTRRTTPFGLLAGVAPASFGAPTEIRIGARHHKRPRPDTAWLAGLTSDLHHDPKARDGLLLVVNNLCHRRGDRLVLPYVREADGHRSGPVAHELTVGLTPVVRAAVEAARLPLTFAELRAAVRARFPEAAADDVDLLIGRLVDREILLTDVASRTDLPDPLAHLGERLAQTDAPVAIEVREVARLLDAYAATAPGEGGERWRDAVTAMRRMRSADLPGDRPPIQVDLRLDVDFRLPEEVAVEAARAADVLWRLAPAGAAHTPQLADYHRAFLDRYGIGRLVPVRELLDPHLGLGVPAGYWMPPGDRPAPPEPATPYPASRDETLGHALHAALAAGPGSELVLDDGLVAALSGEGEEVPPSPTLDLCVQILARSADALAEGDFRLVVANGSYTAGAMAGRFAHLLGLERELAGLHAERGDGPLTAHLFFQPYAARSGNVARTPLLAPRAVAVGCFPVERDGAGDPVDLGDLAVGATGERLYLALASTGREVRVIRPTMLNIVTEAPNIARFLAAVSMSGVRPWAPWQWGRLDALPHLPRVRRGRSVLAPARWRPDPTLCDPALSERAWERALAAWRERLGVPDVLRVSALDRHLDLDLGAPMHRRLLRAQLRERAVPLLQESPLADPAESGWSDGHAAEVVVPLLSLRPGPPAPAPARLAPRVAHPPGGEWLYAKVYVARDRMDALLVRDLPAFLSTVEADVDRWFFLRYVDPAPHLRLRLHGRPERLLSAVLPALHAWAAAVTERGVIRKVVLDTYEPEVLRYGGPDAIEYAERLFDADSRVVAGQLAARARGVTAPPLETLAAMNHAELLRGLGEWDWCGWVLDTYPIELQKEVAPTVRRTAAPLADPDRCRRLAGPPGRADELFAHWPARAAAARAYGRALGIGGSKRPSPAAATAVAGLLHMHANRLLGMDPAAERRSYGLLRSAVRTRVGRTGGGAR
ncbi:lantibiotic dehydratase [Marinactinospora thermotolerans]|uniref:lantibiotic dehydratase n=2 Tax=Marinactinospora thermotolerans TaxID=531310 RepID=UPI003D916637